MFFQRQLLNGSEGIHTIMIGNSRQVKMLMEQIVEQRLHRPAAITVGGVHVEINSRTGREIEARRGHVHIELYSHAQPPRRVNADLSYGAGALVRR